VDQTLSTEKEPLYQLLNVEPDRSQLGMKRRCPFIGLIHDTDTVMAFQTHRNYCHRAQTAQPIRIDYQSTHCLTFAHRHCPVLLEKSMRTLPPEIAIRPEKKRPIAMVISFAVTFILLAIGLMLFSGWQWTSASDWFTNPDSVPVQQEVIEMPNQQIINPAESTPALRPTESFPTTDLHLNEVAPVDGIPNPTPTPITASET
jgi:hypothetical protein